MVGVKFLSEPRPLYHRIFFTRDFSDQRRAGPGTRARHRCDGTDVVLCLLVAFIDNRCVLVD
jgi:hypothetical protein